MVSINNDIYIFGGNDNSDQLDQLNDFYKIYEKTNIIYENVEDSYYSNIFTEDSPYYTEITIKASNSQRESLEETLRFIKLGYDGLTVSNLDVPSYEISLTTDISNIPINNIFDVLASPLYSSDYRVVNSNLYLTNKYRNETFDLVLTIDNIYQYVYRITEPGGANDILLTKPANYKYIIDETEAEANRITFNNIFRHKFITDTTPITITNVSIENTFNIEGNSIFGYLPADQSVYQLSNLFTGDNTIQTVDITASNLSGYEVIETLTFIKGFAGTQITITETVDTTQETVLDIGSIELVIAPTTTGESVNIEATYATEDSYIPPNTEDETTIAIDDIELTSVESITTASKVIELKATDTDGSDATVAVVLEIKVETEEGETDPDSIYAIFTYDEKLSKWVEVTGSYYNPITNTVQVSLEHFSKYAIFEIKPKVLTIPILEWTNVGWQKPTIGTEITNTLLSEALKTKTTFTVEEYESFGTGNLKITNYIKSNNNYFKPKSGQSRIPGNPPVLKESSLYYYLVDTSTEQNYSNIFKINDITDDPNIKISFIDRTDVFTILDNSIHSYSITDLFPENQYFTEISIKASNLDGETTDTLRFLRLGYTTLTVPDLTDESVSNIYLLEEEVSYDVGRTFSIEYNPIESGCNLEIDNCNLIIKDDYRGVYDTIVNLGDYIYNIFRVNEREDNTATNTYSL
jgi:hypothetical protein